MSAPILFGKKNKNNEDRQNLPSPPIVMASETPTALYCHASIFCFSIDFFTILPKSSTKRTSVQCRSETTNHHLTMSIARISLPPNSSNTDLSCILHQLFVRDSRTIEHSLWKAMFSIRSDTPFFVMEGLNKSQWEKTYLGTGKVMFAGDHVRPPIQSTAWW